ncbi:hypothetical protein C8Q75DRAFT_807433 [Abortiporus biennis]|nr:hypothetical protein C8Q75DRAFT_807433 [Abortiporus biennis]
MEVFMPSLFNYINSTPVTEYPTTVQVVGIASDYSHDTGFRNCRRVLTSNPAYTITPKVSSSLIFDMKNFGINNSLASAYRNPLIIKEIKYIFTSPLSVELIDTLASLMTPLPITGHIIAYVICQEHFSLSEFGAWSIKNNAYDYRYLYNHIVDFFEDTPMPESKKFIHDLIK